MEWSFRSALAVALLALTVVGPVAVVAQQVQQTPLPTPRPAVTAQRAGAHMTPGSIRADSIARAAGALPKLPTLPDEIAGMKKPNALMAFGGAAVLIGVFVLGGDAGGALAVIGGATAVYGLYLSYR